jgi:hypothetical protein
MTATYESIATTTVTATSSDIVFSSISSAYTDLILIVNAKQGTNSASLSIRLNTDTGSNYSDTILLGDGSTAASARQSNTTSMRTGLLFNTDGMSILQFMNYSNTTTNKTVISRGSVAGGQARAGVGLWRNTAAINSITVVNPGSPETITGTFTLYGIKAE